MIFQIMKGLNTNGCKKNYNYLYGNAHYNRNFNSSNYKYEAADAQDFST